MLRFWNPQIGYVKFMASISPFLPSSCQRTSETISPSTNNGESRRNPRKPFLHTQGFIRLQSLLISPISSSATLQNMGTISLSPSICPSWADDVIPFFSHTLQGSFQPRPAGLRVGRRWSCRKKDSGDVCAQLRDQWLASLAGDSIVTAGKESVVAYGEEATRSGDNGHDWVVEIDPDALAIVKGSGTGCSAEVFDSPHLQVSVGKRMRKWLNPKFMVQLIRSLNVPVGTTAYIEQSTPFPKDGKQGWWSGGFGYGLWICVLVAFGVSVIPVPSVIWKTHFGLSGKSFSKDDSREAACELFPALSPMFKRKMDHGEQRLY